MKRMQQFYRLIGSAFILAAGVALLTVPARAETKTRNAAAAPAAESLEQKWGIQVTSLRLSAQGRIVDFRYKVLDPGKAATLSDPEARPYLLDQASGRKLLVPKSPKVGPLRISAQKPEAGKVYFALFANPASVVKAGSKVTVGMGDFVAKDLTVE